VWLYNHTAFSVPPFLAPTSPPMCCIMPGTFCGPPPTVQRILTSPRVRCPPFFRSLMFGAFMEGIFPFSGANSPKNRTDTSQSLRIVFWGNFIRPYYAFSRIFVLSPHHKPATSPTSNSTQPHQFAGPRWWPWNVPWSRV